MYDEFPNCTTSGCPNESSHDSGLCFTCRAQKRNFDLAITDGDALKVADLQSERAEPKSPPTTGNYEIDQVAWAKYARDWHEWNRTPHAGTVEKTSNERAFFAGYEPFEPMSDDEMAFAQKRWEFELRSAEASEDYFYGMNCTPLTPAQQRAKELIEIENAMIPVPVFGEAGLTW